MLYAVVATDGAGNSRCFGFVHMPDAATARAARDAVDGRPLEGRPLTVRLRSERHEPRGRGGPGGGGPGGGGGHGGLEGVDDACKLYLGQLPPSATEQVRVKSCVGVGPWYCKGCVRVCRESARPPRYCAQVGSPLGCDT